MRLLLAILVLRAAPALAQGMVDGDLWATGKAGVGTTAPSARLEVKASSSAQTVLQVSGVDETPFIVVTKAGLVALSTTPAANLDISGVGDAGDIGLSLGSGNLYPSVSNNQLLFGYAGQALYRHAIRSVHAATGENNRLDFLLWNPAAGSSSALPSLRVIALETSTKSASGGALHILPVGTSEVELAVSNGTSYAGGTILRASESTHCSRELKTDISHLSRADGLQALEEAERLRHVRFRYRSESGPSRRGLIYEETPENLRGPGKSVSIDAWVLNGELAVQAMLAEIDAAQAQLAALEGRRD